MGEGQGVTSEGLINIERLRTRRGTPAGYCRKLHVRKRCLRGRCCRRTDHSLSLSNLPKGACHRVLLNLCRSPRQIPLDEGRGACHWLSVITGEIPTFLLHMWL